MDKLFDPARHETLAGAPWQADTARAALQRFADDACARFDPDLGWPAHPLDDPAQPDERFHDLYCGAGGVVWALEHLARAGAIQHKPDFRAFAAALVSKNRVNLGAPQHGTQSYLLGDAGLLLLQWTLGHDDAVADDLHEVVRSNLHNPVREALWGSPGTVLAAVFMAEFTAGSMEQARWAALVREAVQISFDEMDSMAEFGGLWLWRQDLYGRPCTLLGAGHGFAGNVFPALRAAALLDAPLAQAFADRALHTLQATARHGGGGINWAPEPETPAKPYPRAMLVQDCHGAPGIICRLAGAPRSAAWDALLLGAGELTWRAGPLIKGASLCHGTAGSAMAMLKLWRRSGDAQWLDRARALAMHAVAQVEQHRSQYGRGRYSLWSGDLGLACVLWNCLQGSDSFPTLDVF